MIRTYTRQDLSNYTSGHNYYLPFDYEEGDEKNDDRKIKEKLMKLLSEADIYEKSLFTGFVKKPSVSEDEYHRIEMKCMYEGYDTYYHFSVVFSIPFLLKDEKNGNKMKWMVEMRPEHVYEGLLNELLDINTMPKMIAALGIKEYNFLE